MQNTNELVHRIAAHPRLWGGAIAGALAGLVAVLAVAPTASTPPGQAPLAPASYRYRHAIVAGDDAELPATIAALEQRVAVAAPSPFDLAELADAYVRRAQATGDARDLTHADALAARSLAILPAPNAAVLVRARIANARHAFRDALALAAAHLRGGPSRAAYGISATAHLALGELPEATAAADAAIALVPDPGAYLTRALVMQARGRDAEAANAFARAVAVEAHGAPAEGARLRALWARFRLRRGDYAGAAALLAEAERVVPGDPLATALRGELALRTGDARAASRLFERAFAASRQVRYLIDQARAIELAGDRAAANALRDQVVRLVRAELHDGGLGHRLDLVEVLLDRDAPGDAAEALGLARGERAARGSTEARFQLARALAAANLADDALAEVRAALATGAREPQLFALAARLERQRGNAARAAELAREARRVDPADAGWRALVATVGGRR